MRAWRVSLGLAARLRAGVFEVVVWVGVDPTVLFDGPAAHAAEHTQNELTWLVGALCSLSVHRTAALAVGDHVHGHWLAFERSREGRTSNPAIGAVPGSRSEWLTPESDGLGLAAQAERAQRDVSALRAGKIARLSVY